MQILYKVASCMLLSLLYTITSLPIITIGASLTALYYTTVKVLRNGEGYVWNEFWNGFRANFKQSTIAWVISIVLLACAVANIVVIYLLAVANSNVWVWIPFIFLFAFVLMWIQYIFPYIARFKDRTSTVLFNTFWMTLFHFWHSLLLLIILVTFLAIPYALPAVIPLAIFFFPSIYALAAYGIIEAKFRIYIKAGAEESSNIAQNVR